jgi:DNA-binding XRE family transcriptional regulator
MHKLPSRRGRATLIATSVSPETPTVSPRPPKQPRTATYSQRLAARLRALREESGLTVDELLAKILRAGYKLSRVTLYQWEQATRSVALDAVPAIAKALGIPARDLFPER